MTYPAEENVTFVEGRCQCGCGELTTIAPKTYSRTGIKKGMPFRYVRGHNTSRKPCASGHIEEDRGFGSPCWIWQGGIGGPGYGQLYIGGVSTYAHRYYYEQRHGSIPTGRELHHLCEIKTCCNPSHLVTLTRKDHIRLSKHTKLSPWKVRAIRRAREEAGLTYQQLGNAFGVSGNQARNVVKGKSWADV